MNTDLLVVNKPWPNRELWILRQRKREKTEQILEKDCRDTFGALRRFLFSYFTHPQISNWIINVAEFVKAGSHRWRKIVIDRVIRSKPIFGL